MKVWVLTSGRYSGYSIEGIFSSEQEARRIYEEGRSADEWGEGKFNEPREWIVDALAGSTYGISHHARIWLDDGDVHSYTSKEFGGEPPSSCVVEPIHGRETWDTIDPLDPPKRFSRLYIDVTSPISKEHAVKVAVEKRQEWLRTRDLSSTPAST